MVDTENIQMRGFHNLKDKDGKIWGFQFGFRTGYYKGLWLSQFRAGDAIVDGVRYPKDTLLWNIQGIDYTREEMFDRMDQYWQVNDAAYVKVPKPGGLTQGYHDLVIEWGYVSNYNNELEKEYDGSGFGNSGPMMRRAGMGGQQAAPSGSKRRLLLVW
jgi:Domain of unknown function (DUF6379)